MIWSFARGSRSRNWAITCCMPWADEAGPTAPVPSFLAAACGGAGGVEAGLCALALTHGTVPPTLNLDNPDPDCPLDFVAHEARERALRHTMSNSFGFGGTNATLVLSRWEG